MYSFTVRSLDQLPGLLQSFRKTAGLTQQDAAARLGITQQTLSALERNADRVSVGRLMGLLDVLGVELILNQATERLLDQSFDQSTLPKGSTATPCSAA